MFSSRFSSHHQTRSLRAAGLATAVYAASEGFEAQVLEPAPR